MTKSTSQAWLKPEILSTLGPNLARIPTRPEKPGPIYNTVVVQIQNVFTARQNKRNDNLQHGKIKEINNYNITQYTSKIKI